jgi:hypothetical protein
MSLALPAEFKAVGIRHGRTQVSNRGQDQGFVFAMLKAIPEARGGASQTLAGESVPILGDGHCSEFLAGLIKRFQTHHASLPSKDGVVDAGGSTLRLMMQLSGAKGAVPAAAPGAPGGRVLPTDASALPTARRVLLEAALKVSALGPRKPTAHELSQFFRLARTEAVPTLGEAQRSLDTLSSGCYIQGNAIRHWCGIYACALARNAGLAFRWTLHGGKIVGPPLVMGNKDMLPGDIAIIAQHSHHFLLTGFASGGKVKTLEGNTTGQLIRPSERDVSQIVGFYRTVPL